MDSIQLIRCYHFKYMKNSFILVTLLTGSAQIVISVMIIFVKFGDKTFRHLKLFPVCMLPFEV